MLEADDRKGAGTWPGREAGHALTDGEWRLLSDAAEDEARAPDGPKNDPPKKPGDDRPGEDGKAPEAAGGGDDPAEGEAGEEEEKGGAARFVRKHPIALAVGAVVLLLAIAAGIVWYLHARHFESTDDAFIDSRQFSLSPKVGGYIKDVLVTDNQHVRAGDVLALIDERDYVVALDQAQAQIAAATANVQSAVAQIAAQEAQVQESQAAVLQSQAAFEFSQVEAQRAEDLATKGAGTVQRSQQTRSELVQAQANLTRAKATVVAAQRQVGVLQAQQSSTTASLGQARAQLEQAQLNLSYTKVAAAQPGRIVRLTGAKGQLAQAGQAIAMFIPDEMWVTANFKETQLADMRPGQKVEMTIDAYPARRFEGHVASIQSGSGTAFSLLPAQNATGNYVKVVQRVPVKLVFDNLPDDVAVGPGMSVVPRVTVR